MRTESFRSVMHRAIRRRGLDPLQGVQSSTLLAIGEYIDEHARSAWAWSQWPEICVWQYRAIRPEWSSFTTYSLNTEVFYDGAYYRCKQGNAGQSPTQVAYWDEITPEMFLNYDDEPQIDAVIDIRTENPRVSLDAIRVNFTEENNRSYLLLEGGISQLWFYVRLKPSRFSAAPWSGATTYQVSDVVYDEASGECFAARAISLGLNPASNPTQWASQPLPTVIADSVVLRTAADLLREDEQFAKADALDAKALDSLITEQDRYLSRSYAL